MVTGSPPLVVIAGATATGKTELAIRLAESLAGGAHGRPVAIISADSRQVFRGLDIGTAKVGAADRARIPHHGLDLVDPDESFSVADFARHARAVLADLGARGGLALLVGGTGLYLRTVARGFPTDAIPTDATMRAELEADLVRDGLPALAARLQASAPILASSVELANPRRVIRALEIARLVGDGLRPAPRGYDGLVVWIGLAVDPDEHQRRIVARARQQFDDGLIEEARTLRERYHPALPAFSAIGYREAWAVLDGALTRDAAIELDAARNVAFSKRQRTWFRAEQDIEWLGATTSDPLAPALEMVRRRIG